MLCEKCGEKNPDQAEVCQDCGFALSAGDAPSEPSEEPAPTSESDARTVGMTVGDEETRLEDGEGSDLTGELVANRYTIRRKVGRGGMGSVYLAFDGIRKQEVALKFINPQHLASRTAHRRFIQEANVCLTLAHPNVIRVYDIFEWDRKKDKQVFLAMEFLEGRSLRSFLRNLAAKDKRLGWRRIAGILSRMT